MLARYPGLQARYRRLVTAVLGARQSPERLPPDEAAQETRLRQALHQPGSVAALPAARRPPQPIPLWLYPPQLAPLPDDARHRSAAVRRWPTERDRRRHRAESVDLPARQSPFLLPFRRKACCPGPNSYESTGPTTMIPRPTRRRPKTWRCSASAGRRQHRFPVRFDLDLPSASEDDLPLGPGIKLPDGISRKRLLVPDYCRVQEMLARRAEPCELPPARVAVPASAPPVRDLATRARLAPRPADGEEPDLDTCLRHTADCIGGGQSHERGLYRQRARQERDLACLLLADLSLSTDAWINNQGRVIETIRDSLFLFAEALAVTGDRFALYGFSSRQRQHVRVQRIKAFGERYTATVRGRINAIKPGYYTRMGAAVRHATLARPADRRPPSAAVADRRQTKRSRSLRRAMESRIPAWRCWKPAAPVCSPSA